MEYTLLSQVRVACPAFSCHFNERHAFTLASPPQETTLTLYIKAVGPWTDKLHQEIALSQQQVHRVMTQYNHLHYFQGTQLPVLHVDGPYGAGNQEWAQCEVAIMVGGGIGVTPYASILKDMIYACHDRTHRCNVT